MLSKFKPGDHVVINIPGVTPSNGKTGIIIDRFPDGWMTRHPQAKMIGDGYLLVKFDDFKWKTGFSPPEELDWCQCPISCVTLLEFKDMSKFPHKCPKCKSPAYIGFATVECSGGCT